VWAAGETATTDPTNLWGFLAATVTAVLGVVAAGRAYVSKHRPDDDPQAPPRSERGVVRQQITTVEQEARDKYEERLLGEIADLKEMITELLEVGELRPIRRRSRAREEDAAGEARVPPTGDGCSRSSMRRATIDRVPGQSMNDVLTHERREEITDETVRRLRRVRRGLWWWFRGFCFVLIGALLLIGYLQTRADVKDRDGTIRDLQTQVRGLGGTPVAGPSGTPGAQGPTGKSGATGATGPGPTDMQVRAAVAAYCSTHSGCTGGATQAQVYTAVKTYCARHACRGATGRTGSTGSTGKTGPTGAAGAPGAAGPGPTPGQISEAVAAYCSDNGQCRGPEGPAGADGTNGSDGRGITSIDCTGLGVNQLTIHYDDDTEQTVPCNP
jgi:hypothetical protein